MIEFTTEAYSGPLDLLLRLITKNEIDIHDIPISELTAQYLHEISTLPPEMDSLSEFLVMAATLLEIKSRMLLPRQKIEEDEDEGDPREALVEQLLAYSRAQMIASELETMEPVGEKFTGVGDRPFLEEFKAEIQTVPEIDTIDIFKLSKIFTELVTRKERRTDKIRAGYGEMPREKFSITEKISFIHDSLKQNKRLNLFNLFNDCRNKNEMVATFLAVLEMVRRGVIHATQPETFGDVEVYLCQA